MNLAPHLAARLRESDRRIVITGASGWLGRATLALLAEALGKPFASRVVAFGSRAGEVRFGEHGRIAQRPLSELATLPHQPTIVLHLAFLTKDRAEAMAEADYRAANLAIRTTVLDALDTIGAGAVFVASSGAAGFADDPAASPAMRLYGALKRDDETAFAAWAEARGTAAAIGRIFNLSGPEINKHRSYALASFILDALAGGPVTVQADHEVWRGYVAIRELVALVLTLLLEAAPGVQRFETGGEAIELGSLAHLVGERSKVAVERPPLHADCRNIYLGDDRAWQALLRRHRIAPVPLAEQIAETAAYLARATLESAHA